MAILFKGYQYQNHILHTEGVNLEDVAAKFGTPCYVYSSSVIEKNFEEMAEALKDIPHLICYAVKANSNMAVLRILAEKQSGADVVSAGELHRALEAGIPPSKIVFSGVGKTSEEIDFALRKKILMFNIESEQELLMIDRVAKEQKVVAQVALRVNPDVNPKTHPYIATGLKKSKFGIPIKKALDSAKRALNLTNVNLVGLSCHIGSQITTLAPYQEAAQRMVELAEACKKLTPSLKYLDLGGGLGIHYKNETPPSITSWAKNLIKQVEGKNLTLIVEPGRSIVGNAGILLTRVTLRKDNDGTSFIVSDAGMNDLIRPSLYEAYHGILPVRYKRYKKIRASVVGPICESGDIMAPTRRMQNFQQGDLLAIMSCGAYGFVMASQYNSRPRAPEVLLKDGRCYEVRRRETMEDLLALEQLPPFLQKKSIEALRA